MLRLYARTAFLLMLLLSYRPALCEDSIASGAAINEGLAAELTPHAPQIITRHKWGASPPGDGLRVHNPTSIILHHTGVAQSSKHTIEAKMRGLQSYSQSEAEVSPNHMKGIWPDVPYHFYIDMLGNTAEGRNINFTGDTNTGYDTTGYIQVVLEGDFEKEAPTAQQLSSLENLLVWVMLSWNIPNERISVHLDHAQTDCPGRNFMSALPGLRSSVAQRREALIGELCKEGAKTEFNKIYCQQK